MGINEKQQTLLKMLPGVDHLLELTKTDAFFENIPKSVLKACARSVVDHFRIAIFDGNPVITEKDLADALILLKVKDSAQEAVRPNLRPVVNATGVVVHTNLGRSLLSANAIENLSTIAGRYSSLEFDLAQGARGSRYSNVEDILCEISGAEAAMVVNNNAGAVLLCLDAVAKGQKVIVSRGELIEIGGSFRIPDVMAKSGGILKEVGTTNRTHLKDYENAVENDTGLFLKVHTSNYSVVGFTAEVSLTELVELGQKYQIPVMEDLGSGTFIDFSRYGLIKEPTVQESVAAGADIITFSGDKLLGGPQAGIIVGQKEILDKIKSNPLTRALRIDKLTLAALEITLHAYRDLDKATTAIPTLRMLTLPFKQIQARAKQLGNLLAKIGDNRIHIHLLDIFSTAGGGALPLLNLPSKGLGVNIENMSSNAVETYMRQNKTPVIGRIEEDVFIMDLRTVQDAEFAIIKDALENILKHH